MELDPHTLHQIIQRIRRQMRCPQCGEQVTVDFTNIRLTGDDFVLLQLKCTACDAFIVLHASLHGLKGVTLEREEGERIFNASSSLIQKEEEIDLLHDALKKSEGSFEQLFKEET